MDNDFQSRITDITMPTLVISGENDQIVPVDDSIKLAEMLPNSNLSIIEDIGHLPHEEAPEEFLRAVDSWMASIAN